MRSPSERELLPLSRQERWLKQFHVGLRLTEHGRAYSVGDGICWVKGLPSARMNGVLTFSDGSEGVVFYLAPNIVGVVMLHQTEQLAAGCAAYIIGREPSVGVGDALLGRVIDPLGRPLDGKAPPEVAAHRALDRPAPPIVARDFVSRPMYSGHKVIDTMIPIGRGQRQLIIGDNGVGKSALAMDILVNQRNQEMTCVYVMVGQRKSSVVQAINTLSRMGALDYTTVVVAEATALPGLKYLAPFTGASLAEHWMWQGRDTLVIYDDLSSHARTFRELSLLLRRPPGREAYPADIFYLHSRLLERATCLAKDQGGGSMTALPIVETKLGELTTYIPTNLVSITDGQIYLDQRLFSAGVLPAIDVTRSVSRIGGKAQHPRIKEAAGKMKLDYLQFLELEVFTRFGSRLEQSVELKIHRGRLLRELLKQERLQPLSAEFQLAWMTAYNEGLLDALQPETVHDALARLQVGLAASPLRLADTHQTWSAAVKDWLELPPEAA